MSEDRKQQGRGPSDRYSDKGGSSQGGQRRSSGGPRGSSGGAGNRSGGYRREDPRGASRSGGYQKRDGEGGSRREGGYQKRDGRGFNRGPRRDDDRRPRREGGYQKRDVDRYGPGPRRDGEHSPRREGGYKRDDNRGGGRREGGYQKRDGGGFNRGPRRDDDRRPRRDGEGGDRREGRYQKRDNDRFSRGPRRDDARGGRREGGYQKRDGDRYSRGPRRDDDRRTSRDDERAAREKKHRSGGQFRRRDSREAPIQRSLTGAPMPIRTETKTILDVPRPWFPDKDEWPEVPKRLLMEMERTAREAEIKEVAVGVMYGTQAFEQGDLDGALEFFEWAKSRAARSVTIREGLGICYYVAGDFESAQRELQTYVRISGRAEHNHILADCSRATGNGERVPELIDLMIAEWEKNPQFFDVMNLIEGLIVLAGYWLDDRNEPELALAAINKVALPDDEDITESHLRLWHVQARAAKAAGDEELAKAALDEINAVNPEWLLAMDKWIAGEDIGDLLEPWATELELPEELQPGYGQDDRYADDAQETGEVPEHVHGDDEPITPAQTNEEKAYEAHTDVDGNGGDLSQDDDLPQNGDLSQDDDPNWDPGNDWDDEDWDEEDPEPGTPIDTIDHDDAPIESTDESIQPGNHESSEGSEGSDDAAMTTGDTPVSPDEEDDEDAGASPSQDEQQPSLFDDES